MSSPPFKFERPSALPLPGTAPEADKFWASLRENRLVLQKCEVCENLVHPPQAMCPDCRSMRFKWEKAEGTGVVYSYVVTHQAIHPSLAGHTPFATVEIELTEGPRIISNLLDVSPDDIEIGMPVEIVFDHITPEVTLPLFRRRGTV